MYVGTPYPILHCDRCGLAKTGIAKSDFPGHAYVYCGSSDAGKCFGPIQWVLRAFRRARAARVVARNPGRALDLGCGDGSFLEMLANQG